MTKRVLVKLFMGIIAVCVSLSLTGTHVLAYAQNMQGQPVAGQTDKGSDRGYTVSDETGNDDSSEEPNDQAPPESGQPSDEEAGDGQTQEPDDDEEAQPDDGEEAQPDDDEELQPEDGEESQPDDGEEALPGDDKKIKPNANGDASYTGLPMHIYAGMQYSLVLNKDGSVWAWGCGEHGQLGNGGATDSPVPVPVAVPGDVYAVSAGYAGSLAVTDDRSVFGWGNAESQTEEEASDDGLLPARIPGLPDISGIFAGKEDNLAICLDGKVMLWQKGVAENMEEASLPQEVPGLSDIRDAVTGNGLIIAVDDRSDVWVCTSASADADDGEEAIPHKLTGDAKTVSAAEDTIYILKNDGTVWTCSVEDILSGGGDIEPQRLEGVDQMESLAVRDDYGLALKSDGTVWIWGDNEDTCSVVKESSDENGLAQVMNLDGIREIAAGTTHCLALGEDGSVWGWGDNRHGAVGDFPDELITEPVLIIPGRGGLLTGDTSLSVSENNTYYLPVEGRGIASFEGKTFTISYDPTALRLIDFAVHLPERYTSAGSVGDELFIESHENGEIIFTCNKMIPPDREWSGLITLLLFEGLKECETRISIAEEEPGDNMEREPANNAEEEPEDDPEEEPEDNPEQEPEDNPEQEPEDGTGQEPEDGMEQEPEDDPEQESENNTDSPYLNKEQYISFNDKRINTKSPKYGTMA